MMEEILAKLLVDNNSIIQQGTNELREAFKNPESTSLLCQLVVSSANPQIRQYAAVLLRKRFSKGKHWSKLPLNTKTQIKAVLIQALVNEPEKTVKNSIAQLIGVIVKYELPSNTWPEIFQFIQQLVASANLAEKELGTYTLATMTEIAPEIYLAHAQSLMTLLAQTFSSLQDLNNLASYYITRTMLHLSCLVEGNQVMVNAYNQMIPLAMNTVQTMIGTNQEKALEVMDLFYELCDCAVSVISAHVKNLIILALTVAKDNTLQDDLRVKAVGLIGCLVRIKIRAIIKHKMVEPIVDILFQLMTSAPDDENEEVFVISENEDNTPLTCATQTLDLLAIHLKPEKLIPHILRHVEPGLRSDNICTKKASYLAMAVLAEGCSEHIRTKYLANLLRCICEGITDVSPVVRNAAFYALGQFSEHLQPDISQYAPQLLPVLFEYLGRMCTLLKEEKKNPPSVDRMFYALETFCENLEDQLIPYLPIFMERLFETLSMDSPVHVKELAISAIGAAGNATKEHMLPYFGRIIATIDDYLNVKQSEETMCLQVQSVDTLGVLARTIGEEHFKPLVGKSLELGIKLITENDDPDLRKAVYGLFASLAVITKTEMAPVLPKILEHIFNSLQSSDGVVTHYKDDETTAFPVYRDLSDNENEDEEDIENTDNEDDEDDKYDAYLSSYTVSNSYIEEKEEAILALRELALYTEAAFLPYLEKAFEETYKLASYPHEDIKKASIDALTQFCINFSKINSMEGKQALLKALSVFVPKLSELIRLDYQLSVAISGLEALSELLKEVKEDVLVGEGHKEAIINSVKDVFTGKVECQDQDDADGDEVEAEQDELLIECAGEVLSSYGKIVSPEDFAPFFDMILPFLIERLNEQKSDGQRSFAVGTISECLSGLKYMTKSLVPQLLMLFKKHVTDADPEVRNNAFFGLGELVVWGKEEMFPHYNEVLQLLSVAIPRELHNGPRDNMAGVIGRLIVTNHSLVDVDNVLPGFLQLLPLKDDFEEYKAVFQSIMTLYRVGHNALKQHIKPIVKIAIGALHDKQVPNEETKHLISKFINCVQVDFPSDWSVVFGELSPELQKILSA